MDLEEVLHKLQEAIDEEDWETSIYLPVERFVKAGNRKVWSNSI